MAAGRGVVTEPPDAVWSEIAAEGKGPAVLLVHGTMDRSTSFGRVTRRLTGRRVIRYDRRGYGRSASLGPATSFRQQVDDLLGVVEATTSAPHQPVDIFGHSYGGTIALAASIVAPDLIGGVIAYESPLPWLEWWPRRSAGAAAAAGAESPGDAAEAFMRRVIGDRRWERIPASTREARRGEGAAMVAELGHLRPPAPVPFAIEDLVVPVIGAHGTEGAAHHARAARTVAQAPRGHLVVVDGASHGVHLTHGGAVVDLLDDLVAHRAREGGRTQGEATGSP